MKATHTLAALLIGTLAGLIAYLYQGTLDYQLYWSNPGGDFWWILRAANDILSGRDPYHYPAGAQAFLYPLPAAFMGLPFTWFPWRMGATIFAGLSSTLMALAVLREGKPWRLLVFLSFPYWQCVTGMQWTPLVFALSAFSWLLPLVVMKPHTTLPVLLLQRPKIYTILLTILFIVVSIVIYPAWFLAWRQQAVSYQGFIPLLHLPLGFVLAFALLRWKDKEARFLFTLSCVPQHVYCYDQLLLWLIPKRWQHMVLMNINSWLVYFICANAGFRYGSSVIILLLYLPNLAFILWPLLEKHLKNRRRPAWLYR